MILLAAGLLLGQVVTDHHHTTQVEHRGARVDVSYRSSVAVRHRQVGTVAPGGRQSTLACRWSATMSVVREARGPAGVLTRTIESDVPVTGTRPGWCDGQREAIARDVAARGAGMRTHLLALAEEDRATLAAELDRHHGAARS